MIKHESEKVKIKRKKRKIRIKDKRRFILSVAIIAILSYSIFYIIGKFDSSSTVSGKRGRVNSIIKAASPSVNMKINMRESNVNYEESSIDIYKPDGHKIAYLTFDDGPYPSTTPGILKILDKYNIKATFFIIGSMAIKYPNLVKAEAKDGQSIGNHTYSHNYQYLYSNTTNFINDVNKCENVLKSILGSDFNNKLVRFPGGSFGTKLAPFREALRSNGYNYVDWNDITGDAEGQNVPVYQLLGNLKKYTKGKEHVVILMHDAASKKTTVKALSQVIEYLKSQGYLFKTLN